MPKLIKTVLAVLRSYFKLKKPLQREAFYFCAPTWARTYFCIILDINNLQRTPDNGYLVRYQT